MLAFRQCLLYVFVHFKRVCSAICLATCRWMRFWMLRSMKNPQFFFKKSYISVFRQFFTPHIFKIECYISSKFKCYTLNRTDCTVQSSSPFYSSRLIDKRKPTLIQRFHVKSIRDSPAEIAGSFRGLDTRGAAPAWEFNPIINTHLSAITPCRAQAPQRPLWTHYHRCPFTTHISLNVLETSTNTEPGFPPIVHCVSYSSWNGRSRTNVFARGR